MDKRNETAAETRQRIVDATMALHAEQGIAATTMKQIARRAGVSIGAVYHHFPSYDDAIRACGACTELRIPPPDPAQVEGGASLPEAAGRLTRALFDYYERLPVLERLRCDEHRFPVLRPFIADAERRRIDLARAALSPFTTEEEAEGTVAALLDPSVYGFLRRSGATKEEAAGRIARVIAAWLSGTTRPRHHR